MTHSRGDVLRVNPSQLLTIEQAAKFAQVSSKTIRRRIAEGRLAAANYGTEKRADWRIAPAELSELKPTTKTPEAVQQVAPFGRRRRQPMSRSDLSYFPNATAEQLRQSKR